jgi:hypothetical protein
MKYVMGISYVNRLDLLKKALDSIPQYWKHTIVIDNSDDRSLRKETEIREKVTIYEPPVPLTVPQKMNWMNVEAVRRGCDVVMYMHDDTVALERTPEQFLDILNELVLAGRRWGVAFTRAEGTSTDYDYFCAFNLEAVKGIGSWDENFMQYFSDTDYYWRLHLAGYEHVYTGLPIRHYGSATTRSDPYRRAVFSATFPIYEEYYKQKWGGTWFEEQFVNPFSKEGSENLPPKPRDWRFIN